MQQDCSADYVGVVRGPTDTYYEAEYSGLEDFFGTMFVETRDTGPATPFPLLSSTASVDFNAWAITAAKWYVHSSSIGGGQFPRRSDDNYVAVVGAASTPIQWPNQTPKYESGITFERNPVMASFVLAGRIEEEITSPIQDIFGRVNSNTGLPLAFYAAEYQQNRTLVTRRVTAHEFSHNFSVNRPNGGPSDEHCLSDRYDQPGIWCLMRRTTGMPTIAQLPALVDGILKFHYQNGAAGVDSEYMSVRSQVDPVTH